MMQHQKTENSGGEGHALGGVRLELAAKLQMIQHQKTEGWVA
jgi:hypothetical protein